MRNMSFSLTTEQITNRTKDVTRRMGWKFLKPGDHFQAVEKAMGLKKGEKIIRICELICISERWESLETLVRDLEYGQTECIREGFPHLDPYGFCVFFIRTYHRGWIGENYNKAWKTPVHRIEFAYTESSSEMTA